MNIVKLVQAAPAFWSLFQQGKELKNLAFWKNTQAVSALVVTAISIVQTFGCLTELPAQDVASHLAPALGGLVTSVGGLVTFYLTYATDSRFGTAPKPSVALPPFDFVAIGSPADVATPTTSPADPMADACVQSDAAAVPSDSGVPPADAPSNRLGFGDR